MKHSRGCDIVFLKFSFVNWLHLKSSKGKTINLPTKHLQRELLLWNALGIILDTLKGIKKHQQLKINIDFFFSCANLLSMDVYKFRLIVGQSIEILLHLGTSWNKDTTATNKHFWHLSLTQLNFFLSLWHQIRKNATNGRTLSNKESSRNDQQSTENVESSLWRQLTHPWILLYFFSIVELCSQSQAGTTLQAVSQWVRHVDQNSAQSESVHPVELR